MTEAATLSRTEVETLDHLERVVATGIANFRLVGAALQEIQEQRLYRSSHKTWAEYLAERWDITPQHGGRLIAAAEVVEILEPTGSIPQNERQARELTPLLPEEKKEPGVVQRAMEEARAESRNDKPPARVIKKAVEKVRPKSKKATSGEGEGSHRKAESGNRGSPLSPSPDAAKPKPAAPKPEPASHHKPGWNELLGTVGEDAIRARRDLHKFRAAVADGQLKEAVRQKAAEYAERYEEVAAELREIAA